jgi:cysteine synthase A
MNIANSIEDLVGKTPIVKLNKIDSNLPANIYGKCEFMNPNSSVKDRIALNMIKSALSDGTINKDTHIIEPTSGNTGVGLASICASFGLKLTLTMPESMSMERRMLMKAYGANLALTQAALGMKGSIAKAEELQAKEDNAVILQQFQNPNNPETHVKTTALEILEDMDGKIDILVSAVGTGGTISGVGKVLKEKLPNVKIIAVEPKKSCVLSGGDPAPHKIQGIGAGFVPDTLDTKVYDEVIMVEDEDAIAMSNRLAKSEGILVGISAGANVYVASELAKKEENKNKNIVTILCDSGERYLSTGIFE